MARAQDESDTEESTALLEPDQDVGPLAERSDPPSSSLTAMAQSEITSDVPASQKAENAEDLSSIDRPNTMSPISSLADRSKTPSPTLAPGDRSVERETPVAVSPSALDEDTVLEVPESPASGFSQIEVASRKEPSGSEATGAGGPAADSANPSNAALQAAGSMVVDSDSNSDDELSSPLMRKTTHRGEGHRKSTPANKAHKRVDRSLRTNSRPEYVIRSSHAKFGLDSSQLIITYESHSVHPLALYMGSIAKTQSELTLARMIKLNSVRSELLECPPMAGDSGAHQKNPNLIRRLCHSSLKDEDAPRLVDAVKALRRCSEVAGDERNLFRCLENLLVMVTKEHDQNEYLEALKGWSKHET
ncbi:hypothetical protein LTR35_018302, partial [Friedmanniomyces endolithicus]